jgi:hypothetical protein
MVTIIHTSICKRDPAEFSADVFTSRHKGRMKITTRASCVLCRKQRKICLTGVSFCSLFFVHDSICLYWHSIKFLCQKNFPNSWFSVVNRVNTYIFFFHPANRAVQPAVKPTTCKTFNLQACHLLHVSG